MHQCLCWAVPELEPCLFPGIDPEVNRSLFDRYLFEMTGCSVPERYRHLSHRFGMSVSSPCIDHWRRILPGQSS